MTRKELMRAQQIAQLAQPAFEMMWSMMWPSGHCAVTSLCLAPLLRSSLEIDLHVVVGTVANGPGYGPHPHAWIESPEGDIIDPTYGQFEARMGGRNPLIVLEARDAGARGHWPEVSLTLDQEEHFRRSIKPISADNGWSAGSGIKELFSSYPRLAREAGDVS